MAILPLAQHAASHSTKEKVVATQKEIEEIQRLMDSTAEAGAPGKTWQQVLQENPHHKGGLAQLASSEQQAQSRSNPEQSKP